MKANLLTVIAAAALLGLGSAVGWMAASSRPSTELGNPPTSDNSTDDFLQRLREFKDDSSAKARSERTAMLRVVCERIRSEPAAARSVWAALRHQATTSAERPDGIIDALQRLAEVMALGDAIEQGLTNCRSMSDFDELLQIQTEVDRAVALRRQSIATAIHRNGESLLASQAPQSLEGAKKAIEQFAEYAGHNDAAVRAVLASSPIDDNDPVLAVLLPERHHSIKLFATSLDIIQQNIAAHRTVLTSESSDAVDPSEHSSGTCERLINELTFIGNAQHTSSMAPWLQQFDFAGEDRPPFAMDAHAKQPSEAAAPDELLARLQFLQALAYNFWALREIQGAETSDFWESRLASVDIGLLESTVSSLYSSVYTRRIEEVQDPERRSHIVQTLLNAKKIGLSAF